MEPVKRSPGKGRGRGLLALTSYEPVPRPSKALAESHLKKIIPNGINPLKEQLSKPTLQLPQIKENGKSISKDIRNNVSSKQINSIVVNGHTEGPKVIAKYNFTGNPDRPGGFPELTIKQGEQLLLLQKGHLPSKNPLWWEVKNANGDVGYVPGNYCMVFENEPTALPWLENKRLEEEKAEEAEKKRREEALNNSAFGRPPNDDSKPVVKPYRSAYVDNQVKPKTSDNTRLYYCDICDKQLNGPTPYNMHMASKAHREEIEYLNSCS